jgi:hypothetical protein
MVLIKIQNRDPNYTQGGVTTLMHYEPYRYEFVRSSELKQQKGRYQVVATYSEKDFKEMSESEKRRLLRRNDGDDVYELLEDLRQIYVAKNRQT